MTSELIERARRVGMSGTAPDGINDLLLALADELDRHQRSAPLCDDCLIPANTGGGRSGCPYCAMQKLAAAMSAIDYEMDVAHGYVGPDDTMIVSTYDVDCDEDRVIGRVRLYVTQQKEKDRRNGTGSPKV